MKVDWQNQPPLSVDDALRKALREPSIIMTPEHWLDLKHQIYLKNPELKTEGTGIDVL